MSPLIIFLCIFIVLVIAGVGCFLFLKGKNNVQPTLSETISDRSELSAVETYEMKISFEDLPALTENDEANLVEVKDPTLLAKIDNIIPGALRVVAGAHAQSVFQNEVKSLGTLYQAIIPKGAKLSQSKSMEGAFRGLVHSNSTGKIVKHVDLKPVDLSSADKLASVVSVNAVMNVASMVVGQYYMSRINKKLDGISSEIDKISDFQENEFKSKVYALVAEIQKTSVFQVETIENDELRIRDLNHLKNLEHECAQLLGQANLQLQGIASKANLDYKSYEKSVGEAEIWYRLQQILLEVMYKIADLTYALNLGAISRKNSTAMYLPYSDQSKKACEKLTAWHMDNIERLEIDVNKSRRTKQGVEGVIGQVAGKIKDDLKYKDVAPATLERIENQTKDLTINKHIEEKDLYNEDVKLIVKDGKLYYLPG